MQDNIAHRKIELQSPEDLAYLMTNVRRAAAEHINEAFPPVEGATDEDELRTRIEELVEEYIARTFHLATPNLSINGLPLSSFPSNPHSTTSTSDPAEAPMVYAPFDARLRARVEELAREEEDLLRDIAELKRTVPGITAAAYDAGVRRGVKEDEEALSRVVREIEEFGGEGGGLVGGEGVGDKGREKSALHGFINGGAESGSASRRAEMEATYTETVQGLVRLKRDMPAVVARMERARTAGGYVVADP